MCFGMLPLPALESLARVCQQVDIFVTPGHYWEAKGVLDWARLDNVTLVVVRDFAALPVADQTAELIVLTKPAQVVELANNAASRRELRRVLSLDGVLYGEYSTLAHGMQDALWYQRIAALGNSQIFALTPVQGDLRTAVPANDIPTIDYFLRTGLSNLGFNRRGLRAAERLVNRRSVHRFIGRSAVVVEQSTRHTGAAPRYLGTIARDAGVDIEYHRWGLMAGGAYISKKLVFMLFDRDSEQPEYIVKLPRHPSLNARLENQFRALNILHARGAGEQDVLPRVAFFGYHAGLAVLGETMLEGAPFLDQSIGTVECPAARAVVDRLIELGRLTRDTQVSTAAEVAAVLDKLLTRFSEIYQPTPSEYAFLAGQIASIAACAEPFPAIFQHGDCGVWNIIITPKGQAALLDWEAAEPHGLPLWDLFYFLRSYCVGVVGLEATSGQLTGFVNQFLSEAALGSLVLDATRRYVQSLKLPQALVEPLFYTCWMHRALKEATRLAPDQIATGHYVSLLRLCIEQRRTPMLERLFENRLDRERSTESTR